MDKFLIGTAQNSAHATEHTQIREEEDIEMLLETFDTPTVSSKTDVIQFWEAEKENNEILYKLAMIVFAIPPTEVQIERDFSKLNFVFSHLRCRLTEERLEDIMVINLNSDLFYDVKKEQLIAQKTKLKEM